jgi:hypothetical protein
MNRKLILLNLALLALAGALAWRLRLRWIETRVHEAGVFHQAARPTPQLPPPPVVAPKSVTPAEYIDVAQKMLFSKDRNPNVILDPPPPPPPAKPMPPLPFYHGQMNFSDPVVLLSTDPAGAQKSYRAGDKIGPFELVSFDRETITLGWEDKTVERKLADLAPKEASPAQPQPQQTAAPQQGQGRPIQNLSSQDTNRNPALGEKASEDMRQCVAGDTKPAGTIVDGYKKVVSGSPFGPVCRWELVK